MHKLLYTTAITLVLATAAMAKSSSPPPQNLYCTGLLDVYFHRLQVTLLAKERELDVDGDVHYLKSDRTDKDANMLYTYDYHDVDGKHSYLALVSVNQGKDKGMYLVQYEATTNQPLLVAPLKCHRSKE